MRKRSLRLLLPILFLLSAACGQRSKFTDFVRQQDIDAAEYFSDSVTDFEVKVFYESSAPPFTGALNSQSNTWEITEQSFTELFRTHTRRKITVPRQLSQMTSFPQKNVSVWDEAQLTAVAQSLMPPAAPGQMLALVIFLHGNYKGEDTVLGLHFSGLKVAFIFKDNLMRFTGTDEFLRRIEQATVVHELGHVVGLTNNGVPMASPHEDTEHPHHSTDTDDVMYWDLVTVVSRIERLNLFGRFSLADAHAYHLP
jgi:predicted Zn-dependent protease